MHSAESSIVLDLYEMERRRERERQAQVQGEEERHRQTVRKSEAERKRERGEDRERETQRIINRWQCRISLTPFPIDAHPLLTPAVGVEPLSGKHRYKE